jgi:hypothetical protein
MTAATAATAAATAATGCDANVTHVGINLSQQLKP